MRTLLQFLNIESTDPTPNMGPNINSILPDALPRFQRKTSGSFAGALMYSQTGPAGAGGLLSWNLDPPMTRSGIVLPHLKYEYDLFVASENWDQEWRAEFDLKIVTIPAATGTTVTNNIINLSTQANASRGWAFQADNAAKVWADEGITEALGPDTWNHVGVTASFDQVAKTFGVESLNGVPVPTPQVLPWQTDTGWFAGTVGGIKVQVQGEQQFAGSLEFMVRNINVYASDQPF